MAELTKRQKFLRIFMIISAIFTIGRCLNDINEIQNTAMQRKAEKTEGEYRLKGLMLLTEGMALVALEGKTGEAEKKFEEAKKYTDLAYYYEAEMLNNWDEESKKRFEEAYEKRYAEAGAYLGEFEEKAGNVEKAKEIYEEASNIGSGKAIYNLSRIYFKEENIDKIKELEKKFSERKTYGMTTEMHEDILDMIEGGENEREFLKIKIEADNLAGKDKTGEVIKLYEEAKKYNKDRAEAEIGRITYSSIDPEKGFEILEKSAENGSLESLRMLARISILESARLAEEYLKLLIEVGDIEMKIHLAKLIKNQPDRRNEAKKLLIDLSDYRFADAKTELLTIYIKEWNEKNGVEKKEVIRNMQLLVQEIKGSKGEYNLDYLGESVVNFVPK